MRPSRLLWPDDDDRDLWRDFLFDGVCRLQYEEDLAYELKHSFKEAQGAVPVETLAAVTGLI